jgi:hypothetical protein
MPIGVVSEYELARATQQNPLRQTDSREPTSGLEPLSCSLRVIHRALQGRVRACKTRISEGFPYSGLQCVAPYCVPSGVREESMSKSYPSWLGTFSCQVYGLLTRHSRAL